MKTYFAKFISGAEEIVETYLKNKDIDILMIEDGIVVFKTNKNQNELNQLNIFNSNFLLLYSFKNIQTSINHLRKVAISLFLKEKAEKLWWRPRWKKIKEGCFLVALYTNPFERAFSPKAVLLDKESRYNKFVASKNRKRTWYLIPRWMAYDHSYYHCL